MHESFDEMQEWSWESISTNHSLKWADIIAHGSFLPQHNHLVEKIITRLMGYLPYQSVYYPHESFIKSEIESFKNGQITFRHFWGEVLIHVHEIRNEDMTRFGVTNSTLEEDRKHLSYYSQEGLEFARLRISKCLGYEPKFEHSYKPEMWLCDRIIHHAWNIGTPINEMDYRAATMAKFREIHFTQGWEEAERSYFACSRDDIDIEGLEVPKVWDRIQPL
jgi:hypothetical protein